MPDGYHLSLAETGWAVRPAQLTPPAAGEVHVFRFAIDRPRNLGREISHIANHQLLRLLAEYEGCDLQTVKLRKGRYGKPYLARPYSTRLHFNLSHSGGYGLAAFTFGREIGADIEAVIDIEMVELAERFFSPPEVNALFNLGPTRRREAFFQIWTRKEAYIKGLGLGLTAPLDAFGVSVAAEQPVRLVRSDLPGEGPDRWALHSFTCAPDVPGAIAVRGPIERVRYYDLD